MRGSPRHLPAAALASLLLASGCASKGRAVRSTSDLGRPNAEAILALAARTRFAADPVTDDRVSAEVKALNPDFGIRVFFRKEDRLYSEDEGVVAGRIELRGIPKRYGIPDGTYFLWLGGPISRPRAFLARAGASGLVELEVRDKPSLAEQAVAHEPTIHGGMDVAALPLPGAPPGPRPPPPPPPSWREVCYPYAPTDHGAPGGWQWVRIPDG